MPIIRFVCLQLVLAVLLLLGLVTAGSAHTVRPAVVSVVIMEDNSLRLTVKANAELLMARVSPEYSDTNESPQAADYDRLRSARPEQLAALFDRFAPEFLARLSLTTDGRPVALEYVGVDVKPEPDFARARNSFIFLRTPPLDADSFVWNWPEQYGSNVLRVQKEGSEQMSSVWLKQGEASDAFPLAATRERSRLQVAQDYIVVGFEHIVPKGLDHMLFVLGIFLLSTSLATLLWQVTAFTVAHTITLGLSIYGFISAPASIVEPLIALSIVYVGIEDSLSSKLKPWRIVLVFMFGLLHGMGFAGVLSDIGLPPSEYFTALITFNIGVELGQLTVILTAFAVLGWWRSKPWYRQRITVPLSLFIAAVGLYWTWERVLG